MRLTQRRMIQDQQGRQRDAVWDVDLNVVGSTSRWAGDRARLEKELRAMAEMYPAWTLTMADGYKPLDRPGAADVAVPTGGAWRWASDGAPISVRGDLMWEGLLPAPLGGLKQAEQKLQRKYPIEFISGNPWTTVPIRAICGPDFPRGEPWVFYDERWLKTLGVHGGSAAHILGEGRMCLFYPGHWKRGYTVADVLSQRVVNHVYSVLKMANGVNATKAFIGRIHNEEWRPSV